MVTKAAKLAGGIWKWLPMLLSRVVPCLMKRVCVCANIVLGMNVHIKTGIILSICFVSSTWVTVHSFHESLDPLLIAALFKNLLIICINGHISKPIAIIYCDLWTFCFKLILKIFKTCMYGRGFHTLIKGVSFSSPTDVGSYNPPPSGPCFLASSHFFLQSMWDPTKSTLFRVQCLCWHTATWL